MRRFAKETPRSRPLTADDDTARAIKALVRERWAIQRRPPGDARDAVLKAIDEMIAKVQMARLRRESRDG